MARMSAVTDKLLSFVSFFFFLFFSYLLVAKQCDPA